MSYQAQKRNYLEMLRNDLSVLINEDNSEEDAFTRLAAQWLGYDDLDDEQFIFYRDRGIDFYVASPRLFEVFQVKSHRLTSLGDIDISTFDKEGVGDIRRACELMANPSAPTKTSEKVTAFLDKWRVALNNAKSAIETADATQKKDMALSVHLNLVLFGENLTTEARDEFDTLCASLANPKIVEGVSTIFRPALIVIDDLLEHRWREQNLEWKDKSGASRCEIDLEPDKLGANCFISGEGNAVFYCKAVGLIQAFEDFGYQIFEPNVRAKIGKSRVNEAIEESISTQSGRKMFRYLNNGVTISCDAFARPRENRTTFRITRPGVINGLQTVTSIYDGFKTLRNNPQERADFEKHCLVLVRLLDKNKIPDLSKIVLATNTQNPMLPRNLRSNNSEQKALEKLFADFRWFYERKQGAWDAFASNPKQWRTLHNKTKDDFRVKGSKRILRVDSEELAQSWLAFIGFSNEAAHNRKEMFEEKQKWYELIFLSRTVMHASAYNFDNDEVIKAASPNTSPSPRLMLAAYLAREFSKACSLSPKVNHDLAVQRLKSSASSANRTEDDLLSDDPDYLLEQVVGGMSLVFVDFLGYILFETLGSNIHEIGKALLSSGVWKKLFEEFDPKASLETIRELNYDPNDVLAISWYVFKHCVGQMLGGNWKEKYKLARSRSRFNHSNDTRKLLYTEFRNLDNYMKKTTLTVPWAAVIPERKGITGHLKSVLGSK